MARSQASRKYQLTINNPTDHGFTREVLHATLVGLKSCIYWCMCDEIGEQGTLHTHLYLAFRNPAEFSMIQERFYGAHIEIARGSHHENRDYIRKEGKWQDDAKNETNLPDTFEESGELPPEQDRRQKQTEAIMEMVENGASTAEILREYPTAMTRLSHIEQARQTLLEDEYRKKWRTLSVTYLHGMTGTGKTRSVMETYGYENVYRVTDYTHPFDDYKCEKVIIFEEFRSSLLIADMLKYLDGYPVMLPCRYANKVACFDTVYIISNIPLEQQYPNVQHNEPETYRAFLRRIHNIEELLLGFNETRGCSDV